MKELLVCVLFGITIIFSVDIYVSANSEYILTPKEIESIQDEVSREIAENISYCTQRDLNSDLTALMPIIVVGYLMLYFGAIGILIGVVLEEIHPKKSQIAE